MFLQFGVIAVAIFGDQIFAALGIQPPELYGQLREKRFGVVLAAWIVGNSIQNSLSATGAFEVYSNGQQVRPSIKALAARAC